MGNIIETYRQYESLGDLHDIAATLGGEVFAKWIRCPSPGKPDDDRSCFIRIDPTRPNDFYVYDCDGSKGAAYALVRERLNLSEPPRVDHSGTALRIWKEALPATGTLVERYLRSRAITLIPPDTLRFHPDLRHGPTGRRFPAMVAARADVNGRVVAIHRTYLRHDGSAKAMVDPAKMDLGSNTGTAIRLAPVAEELVIGEGIENTLSFMQDTKRPGWAAGSCAALREVVLPPEVRSVIIAADCDAPGVAAAKAAATTWTGEGRRVRIALPDPDMDFNDMLRAGR